ncbi:MAG: MopE-related protein [Myxococcota bacterium]
MTDFTSMAGFSRFTFTSLGALLLATAGACGDDDGRSLPEMGVDMRLADAGNDVGADADVDAPLCIDEDDDGYGEGCALGADCNDADQNINPAAVEVCDGEDNDCDGSMDESVDLPNCELSVGVCVGATARCGDSGVLACVATDYGADYEAMETSCDGLDNDCDGTTDEGCPCEEGSTQPCGSDIGVCMAGVQTCVDNAFGACEGEVTPMGETCDGLDNDCDGVEDEDLSPPACPLQLGVCSGSTRACGGVAGFIACSGTASYGGDYQAEETLCDGLDNDCDGVTDEGCECTDGSTQACGTDVGACTAGVQTCVTGRFGSCAGEVAPAPETCNGIDDNCNGEVDDGVMAPFCELQMGVCVGSVQPCVGESGFEACRADDYGSAYEAEESLCDGQDNDCDGTVDEGCDCTNGETQACGLSAGVCQRGVQTCVDGEFDACEGVVEPSPEVCNGQDDDCNGMSDDNLMLPSCALTEGVCAGTTQQCGGAAGLLACTGADYGPNYVADEDGAANEGLCDGFDNDCDGVADEGCTVFPLLEGDADSVFPSVYNRHVVSMTNFDGNWDLQLLELNTGTLTRLTATPASEWFPAVYGNHVAFIRGDSPDAPTAALTVLNMLTGVENVVATNLSGSTFDLFNEFVVYAQFDGTQSDVFAYSLASEASNNLTDSTDSNEFDPSLRGARLAFVTDATGDLRVAVFDALAGTTTLQVPAAAGAFDQRGPMVDYAGVAWSDSRRAPAADPIPFDVYGAFFLGSTSVFPNEVVVIESSAQHVATSMDGVHVSVETVDGTESNVGFALPGNPLTAVTTSGTAAAPSLSGTIMVWHDTRLGNFTLFASGVSTATLPGAGDLEIAEILADPGPIDANGDGNLSGTQDEYVEIRNTRTVTVQLDGATLSDGTSVRHVFPSGTNIPAGASLVVFGGGSIDGRIGGAIGQTASSGSLGLNNDGDTLTLTLGGATIEQVSYGREGGNDECITRQTDMAGTVSFVRNSALSVAACSPGVDSSGFGY